MVIERATARAAAPRFCPRCDGDVPAGVALCPRCGERGQDQGVCAICERAWHLPEGALCPKHDVPLLGWVAHREAVAPPEDVASGWVTIARFRHTMAAEPPRIRLEAEGIPVFLDGARMGANALHNPARGAVSLMVPRDLEADARVVLDQSWAPIALPDDDLEDAWDDLAPSRGAGIGAIVALSTAFVFALPLLHAIWTWLRSL